MGNIIPSPLRVKQILYPGHFQKLEILGVQTQIKHAGRVNPQSPHMRLERAWLEFLRFMPSSHQERRRGDALHPGLRYMAGPAAPFPPCPHLLHSADWFLLLKTFWSRKDSCYLLWLNSGPLGAWQGYGSLLPPPKSRLFFPGSWELAGPSADMRLPYDWCCSRSGICWAGVTGCISWHDGLLLLLLSRFSRVWLCATPWMAAHQAPPSLGFSRQEHWSGLPFPSPIHESEKWKGSRSVMSNS